MKWTEGGQRQVDKVDRNLSTWPKKSGVISVRYKAIFWPLSTLSSTGNSGIFLSG